MGIQYKGQLYGRSNGKYIPLTIGSEHVDSLTEQSDILINMIDQYIASNMKVLKKFSYTDVSNPDIYHTDDSLVKIKYISDKIKPILKAMKSE
jgi:hypothetical protein